jgi:hypothetical protein
VDIYRSLYGDQITLRLEAARPVTTPKDEAAGPDQQM